MRIIKLEHVKNYVVFSDIHLRDPKSATTSLFLSALKSLPEDIDTVFLLGDIFDFIAASHSFFITLWSEFFTACEMLKNKGVRIYFAEGNHDFGFEHFNRSELEKYFTDFGDVVFQFQHPTQGSVTLCHGDNIVCPPFYLKFRALVKAKYFQKIISFLFPGFFLHFIFSKYAKLSRKRDHYREISNQTVLKYIKDFLFEENNKNKPFTIDPKTTTLILGHVHINMDEQVQNPDHTHHVRILIGPDWFSKPSFLIYRQHHDFKRIFL